MFQTQTLDVDIPERKSQHLQGPTVCLDVPNANLDTFKGDSKLCGIIH